MSAPVLLNLLNKLGKSDNHFLNLKFPYLHLCLLALFVYASIESKKEGKNQESIQLSTTPDLGYQWESDNVTIRHHKRESKGQPFPSR